MAMSHWAQAEQKPRVPFFVPLFNPFARRLLGAGIPLGPNGLLTVRGRKSGLPRTTPVAVVDINGRRWIIATFGDVNWARNLRADPQATITIKGRETKVRASELSIPERALFFKDVLAPYVRSVPFGSFLIGRVLGARELLTDPDRAA